jgi:hypothetical protein
VLSASEVLLLRPAVFSGDFGDGRLIDWEQLIEWERFSCVSGCSEAEEERLRRVVSMVVVRQLNPIFLCGLSRLRQPLGSFCSDLRLRI